MNLPETADILYAELIWGGNYKYLDQDISDKLATSVSFTTPKSTYSISPDSQTGGNIESSSSYVRTANITDIIKSGGSGNYSVGGVPSLLVKNNPYNNYAGYTIAIAYHDPKEPARNISLFVGSEQVGADQYSNIAEVNGFATPIDGKVYGKLYVSSQEGDSMYGGDEMKFGSTKTNLQNLSGPNNPSNNFFASQINDSSGELDESGTFGSENQTPWHSNHIGVRQGWDITAVSLDDKLTNNQTTAFAQGTSTGDSYVINALAVEIDVNSANLKFALKPPANTFCKNDNIDLSFSLANNGSTLANDIVVLDFLPKGLKLNDGSLKIDGNLPGDALVNNNGVWELHMDKINKGVATNISFSALIENIDKQIIWQPKADYSFQMVVGGDFISSQNLADQAVINQGPYCGQTLPPVAIDDSVKIKQGETASSDVLLNDYGLTGTILPETLKITVQGSHGSATIVNGKISYTPDITYSGKDELTYQICDSQSLCSEAKLLIEITPANPPIATDDSGKTEVNKDLEVDILQNDQSPNIDKSKLTISITKNPENGEVKIVNQKLVYTPKSDYVGNDTLEYKICDQMNLCDTAKVSIEVSPKPVPPDAVDDKANTLKNEPVTIDSLLNDNQQKALGIETVVNITSQPNSGKVVYENGKFNYTPNKDFVGTDQFEYEICNGFKLCDKAIVQIDIVNPIAPEPTPKDVKDPGSNELPPTPTNDVVTTILDTVKANPDTTQTNQDSSVVVDILKNDEYKKITTIIVTEKPKNGTTEINLDQKLVYTPNKGFVGDDTLKYKICNQSLCSETEVKITVKPKGIVLGDAVSLVRSGGSTVYTGGVFLGLILTLVPLSIFLSLSKKPEDV